MSAVRFGILAEDATDCMKLLAREGCAAVIVVHDLDRNPHNGELNDEPALRRALEEIEVPSTLTRLICIPVEELEAWFWADPEVLALVRPGTKGPRESAPRQAAQGEAHRALAGGQQEGAVFDSDEQDPRREAGHRSLRSPMRRVPPSPRFRPPDHLVRAQIVTREPQLRPPRLGQPGPPRTGQG